jgi:hypothetical protein
MPHGPVSATAKAKAKKKTTPATGGTVTVPYAEPSNEAEWADDFLSYIDAPDTKPNVEFITAAEIHEGTFYPNETFIPRQYGDDNRYNPLDSTQFEAGGVVWAENGGDPVWQFSSLKAGLESNASIIEDNAGDYGLLKDLRSGSKTAQQLANDVAASDWGTGGGPGSAAETGYSQAISNTLQDALAEVDSGLGTPSPATLTGFNPLPWLGLGGVAVSGGAAAIGGGTNEVKKVVGDATGDVLKAMLPTILEIIGVLFGGGLVVLGAYKAAGKKASDVPGVSAIVNRAQKAPEVAAA